MGPQRACLTVCMTLWALGTGQSGGRRQREAATVPGALGKASLGLETLCCPEGEQA